MLAAVSNKPVIAAGSSVTWTCLAGKDSLKYCHISGSHKIIFQMGGSVQALLMQGMY